MLADEVNRARSKGAELEAMQERHVTIGEQSAPPFLVLATVRRAGRRTTGSA